MFFIIGLAFVFFCGISSVLFFSRKDYASMGGLIVIGILASFLLVTTFQWEELKAGEPLFYKDAVRGSYQVLAVYQDAKWVNTMVYGPSHELGGEAILVQLLAVPVQNWKVKSYRPDSIWIVDYQVGDSMFVYATDISPLESFEKLP